MRELETPYKRLVSYRLPRSASDRNKELLSQVFKELAETCPDAFSYLALQVSEEDFLHLAVVDDVVDQHPLHSLATFRRWSDSLQRYCPDGPEFAQPRIVGTYRIGRLDAAGR